MGVHRAGHLSRRAIEGYTHLCLLSPLWGNRMLSNRTQPWNYSSGGVGGANGYLYVGDDLRDAMTHNPHMRLLVCSGRFDLATPYFATDYTLNHLTLVCWTCCGSMGR